jgi:hypothetical protein
VVAALAALHFHSAIVAHKVTVPERAGSSSRPAGPVGPGVDWDTSTNSGLSLNPD